MLQRLEVWDRWDSHVESITAATEDRGSEKKNKKKNEWLISNEGFFVFFFRDSSSYGSRSYSTDRSDESDIYSMYGYSRFWSATRRLSLQHVDSEDP